MAGGAVTAGIGGRSPMRPLRRLKDFRFWHSHAAGLPKALDPDNRRTSTDLELFGRLASRSSSFDKMNYAHSQLTRVRSAHCPAPRRINALESLLRRHSGRTCCSIPVADLQSSSGCSSGSSAARAHSRPRLSLARQCRASSPISITPSHRGECVRCNDKTG